ncbi:MAG: hypothetical protein U5M23_00285 [Marinagarivorans sp.]|nr:hypothetical protein [Marinagarivorans sp.]
MFDATKMTNIIPSLLTARLDANIKLSAAAEALDVATSTLQSWESPLIDTARKIPLATLAKWYALLDQPDDFDSRLGETRLNRVSGISPKVLNIFLGGTTKKYNAQLAAGQANLDEMRLKQKLNCFEVAKCLGVHYTTILLWETENVRSGRAMTMTQLNAYKKTLRATPEQMAIALGLRGATLIIPGSLAPALIKAECWISYQEELAANDL